jgi:hypothetical protein
MAKLNLPFRRRPMPHASRPEPASGPGLRVLFLGNSLTYTNDLPSLVQAIARSAGEAMDVAALAAGALEDHWNHGDAVRRIKAGGWHFVVMQQGPSSLPEGGENLRFWTRKLAEPIRAAGARPALYMVWPSFDRLAWFDAVRNHYTQAAEDVDGILIPAGEAWRAAWRRDGGLALFRRDGLHPTPAGSYLAALSIFGMLFDRSPVGLPARINIRGTQVPPALAPLLQEAAAEANEQYGKR